MNGAIELRGTGLSELDTAEMREIDGGFPFGAAAILYVVVTEWAEIKRATVDAWKGEYDPPSLRG